MAVLFTYLGLNPFHTKVNGKTKKVKNIIIYDNNGIVLEVGRGWFDNRNEYSTLELPTDSDEVKLRRKEDFSRNEVFAVKSMDRFAESNDVDLYIPNSIMQFEKKHYKVRFNVVVYEVWKSDKYNIAVEVPIRNLDKYLSRYKEKFYNLKDNLNLEKGKEVNQEIIEELQITMNYYYEELESVKNEAKKIEEENSL